MTQGPIEGVEGHDDESPRAKAWGRYLEQQDSFAAEDAARSRAAEDEATAQLAREEERRLRAQAADAPPLTPARKTGISGAMGLAGAAGFGMSVKQALTESPEQKRMDFMAAMQAEALARLEIGPHGDNAVIAQSEALGGGEAARMADRSIAQDRLQEREAKDDDVAARRASAAELERRPAKDKIARGSASAKQREEPKQKPDSKPKPDPKK